MHSTVFLACHWSPFNAMMFASMLNLLLQKTWLFSCYTRKHNRFWLCSTHWICSSAQLLIDYVCLGSEERKRFAQSSHEHLIEQLQSSHDEPIDGAAKKIALNFNHPCKFLTWAIKMGKHTSGQKCLTCHPTDVNALRRHHRCCQMMPSQCSVGLCLLLCPHHWFLAWVLTPEHLLVDDDDSVIFCIFNYFVKPRSC